MSYSSRPKQKYNPSNRGGRGKFSTQGPHKYPNDDYGILVAPFSTLWSQYVIGHVADFSFNNGNKLRALISAISPNGEFGLLMSEDLTDGNKFKSTDLVRYSDLDKLVIRDVDPTECLDSRVFTDKDISKFGSKSNHRYDDTELVPFYGEGGFDVEESEEMELNSNDASFTPSEMFLKNETDFKVTSSYCDTLQGYTVPVDRDAPDYQAKLAKATAVAAEMEKNSAGDADELADLENEEEKYSAVLPEHRPSYARPSRGGGPTGGGFQRQQQHNSYQHNKPNTSGKQYNYMQHSSSTNGIGVFNAAAVEAAPAVSTNGVGAQAKPQQQNGTASPRPMLGRQQNKSESPPVVTEPEKPAQPVIVVNKSIAQEKTTVITPEPVSAATAQPSSKALAVAHEVTVAVKEEPPAKPATKFDLDAPEFQFDPRASLAPVQPTPLPMAVGSMLEEMPVQANTLHYAHPTTPGSMISMPQAAYRRTQVLQPASYQSSAPQNVFLGGGQTATLITAAQAPSNQQVYTLSQPYQAQGLTPVSLASGQQPHFQVYQHAPTATQNYLAAAGPQFISLAPQAQQQAGSVAAAHPGYQTNQGQAMSQAIVQHHRPMPGQNPGTITGYGTMLNGPVPTSHQQSLAAVAAVAAQQRPVVTATSAKPVNGPQQQQQQPQQQNVVAINRQNSLDQQLQQHHQQQQQQMPMFNHPLAGYPFYNQATGQVQQAPAQMLITPQAAFLAAVPSGANSAGSQAPQLMLPTAVSTAGSSYIHSMGGPFANGPNTAVFMSAYGQPTAAGQFPGAYPATQQAQPGAMTQQQQQQQQSFQMHMHQVLQQHHHQQQVMQQQQHQQQQQQHPPNSAAFYSAAAAGHMAQPQALQYGLSAQQHSSMYAQANAGQAQPQAHATSIPQQTLFPAFQPAPAGAQQQAYQSAGTANS